MAWQKSVMDRFTEKIDLPGELLPGQTLVELAGDGRVLIENHNGVTEYCRDKITVRVGYGSISVCGNNLELTRMTRDQMVISGRIDGITLCRRKR